MTITEFTLHYLAHEYVCSVWLYLDEIGYFQPGTDLAVFIDRVDNDPFYLFIIHY